jgi:hypothetical protein
LKPNPVSAHGRTCTWTMFLEKNEVGGNLVALFLRRPLSINWGLKRICRDGRLPTFTWDVVSWIPGIATVLASLFGTSGRKSVTQRTAMEGEGEIRMMGWVFSFMLGCVLFLSGWRGLRIWGVRLTAGRFGPGPRWAALWAVTAVVVAFTVHQGDGRDDPHDRYQSLGASGLAFCRRGSPLSGGGFVMAATVHIFHIKRFEPILAAGGPPGLSRLYTSCGSDPCLSRWDAPTTCGIRWPCGNTIPSCLKWPGASPSTSRFWLIEFSPAWCWNGLGLTRAHSRYSSGGASGGDRGALYSLPYTNPPWGRCF